MGSNLPDNFIAEEEIMVGSRVQHSTYPIDSIGEVLEIQTMPNKFDYETKHAYVYWGRGKPIWVEVNDLELAK